MNFWSSRKPHLQREASGRIGSRQISGRGTLKRAVNLSESRKSTPVRSAPRRGLRELRSGQRLSLRKGHDCRPRAEYGLSLKIQGDTVAIIPGHAPCFSITARSGSPTPPDSGGTGLRLLRRGPDPVVHSPVSALRGKRGHWGRCGTKFATRIALQ